MCLQYSNIPLFKDSGGPLLNILMELITRFRHPVALEIRKTLETEQDYVSALSHLSWTYMIAPSYLIVGGKDGDGAVITRQCLIVVDQNIKRRIISNLFFIILSKGRFIGGAVQMMGPLTKNIKNQQIFKGTDLERLMCLH